MLILKKNEFLKKKKEAPIPEDRKVKFISEVDSLVPAKLNKLFSLIEEVIETDEKTLFSVFEKIEESGETAEFIYSLIEYSFKIRPLTTNALLSLHCLLSQKHGYKSKSICNGMLYSMLLGQGIICTQKIQLKSICVNPNIE